MTSLRWLILILATTFSGVQTAKILFLFVPSYSHLQGPMHVAAKLASRGHVVWNALSTELAKNKLLQLPRVNILTYNSTDDVDSHLKILGDVAEAFFEDRSSSFMFERLQTLSDRILRDEVLLQTIKKLNFDLIIFNANPSARMLTIIAYRLSIPFLFLGDAYEPVLSRTPFAVSTSPYRYLSLSPVMNFWERVYNFITSLYYFGYDPSSSFRCVAKYAPEKPYVSIDLLTARGLIWLIDREPFLDFPRATTPNFKIVGCLSSSKPKPLQEPFKTFMDNAKEGVVVVSFGSNVNSFPEDIFDKLVNAFRRTKYRFIMRSNRENQGSNILTTKWMPQTDLLGHHNTKLFITHCGANGQNEGFLNAVPMIGFPMFVDQFNNAMRLEYHGYGKRMDLKSFKVEDLVVNINEVIQNSSYTEKVKKAAKITKLRPRSPVEESVYWIEHVIKYGGDHLRSHGQNMPLYQFYSLDVLGLLVGIFHVLIFLLVFVVRFTCCSKTKNKKKME